MDYDKVAHLGFIQNVIARMAGNSFLCKGWAISVFCAFLVFFDDADAEACMRVMVPIMALIVLCMFWYLDAWFLHQEHLYRHLYDHIRLDKGELSPYDMCTKVVDHDVKSTFRLLLARSVWTIYFPLIVSFVVLYLKGGDI